MSHKKQKLYDQLRRKRLYIPLYVLSGIIVALLLLSPFIPQFQSSAQNFSLAHPSLTRVFPKSLQAPNVSLPTSGNWLVIPSAAIRMPIIEGSSIAILDKYVGVWHETGNVAHNYVLAGHKLQYFRSVNQSLYHLNTLHAGDTGIYIISAGKPIEYRVVTTAIVPPTDVSILNATTDKQLTIYTCNDFFNHARFVLIARPI